MVFLEEVVVPHDYSGTRLSDSVFYLFTIFPSVKSAKKAVKEGRVFIDGIRGYTGDYLQRGQTLTVKQKEKSIPHFDVPLQIVHLDDHLCVVNKPAGMPVNGNSHRTLEHALAGVVEPSSEKDALLYSMPVHRIDSATSGLVIAARTSRALTHVGQLFEERKIRKRYVAVVMGRLTGKGLVEEPVEGRSALTRYRVLGTTPSLRFDNLTLVECMPETGRTHQIRKHMAFLGHPIAGDPLYHDGLRILKGKGLFLSAVGLSFTHPETGENLELSMEMPKKFSTLIYREEARWRFYHETSGDESQG